MLIPKETLPLMAQRFTIPLTRTLPKLCKPAHLRPPISQRSITTMAPLPSSMHAIQIPRNGGPEVLDHVSIPVPQPADSEVLVRNHFAGVNYIDTYFRSGLYKAPHLPLVMGREAAGEVVAAPASSGLQPGQRVVYMGGTTGSYAEYTTVPARNVIAVPAAVDTQHAVAAYLQGLTAWTFIREAGQVVPGQWVLVHAAAGGVGSLLVQMLRHTGAFVIGTASTDDKCALARKLGAGWTVNSKTEDVVARVKEITEGHGADVIFDGVGKATFDADLEVAAMKAHLVSYGNASGAVPPVDILKLAPKNIKLMRPIVNGFVAERADLEKYTGELFDMLASGKFEVNIHQVYPLKDARRAHEDIESRNTKGKLLIKCD